MAIGGVPAPSAGVQPLVRFTGVSKTFSGHAAVKDLSLDIVRGEFFALLGPSGCGKTTLLRLLAGFETPDAGQILLEGEDIAAVPPHRRPVNMMFQSYALFPHLTVERNVSFGLRQENLSREEIATRVREMLTLVQIEPLARRKPHQLSGGQRQRVALARALVKRPKVFLLDEPLAALDKKLRTQTQFELKELQRRLGLTFIIVTHDQDEAMTMADRIGVMNHGMLVQVGSPADLYERPQSRWVAEFIGDVNIFEGRLSGGAVPVVDTASGLSIRVSDIGGTKPGDTVCVAVRPERIRLSAERPASDNVAEGQVIDVGYLGDVSVYGIASADGRRLRVTRANLTHAAEPRFSSGDRVWLGFSADAGIVLTR